jgi:hypothetical protein
MAVPNAEYPTPDPDDYDLEVEIDIDPDAPDPNEDTLVALPYIETLGELVADSDRARVYHPEVVVRSMEDALRGNSVTGPYLLVDRRPEHLSEQWTSDKSRFLRQVFYRVGRHAPKKHDDPSV